MNQTETYSDEATTKWLGSTVRLCHKRGRITDVHERAYTVHIEIGGVHQNVTVGARFAHEQLED